MGASVSVKKMRAQVLELSRLRVARLEVRKPASSATNPYLPPYAKAPLDALHTDANRAARTEGSNAIF